MIYIQFFIIHIFSFFLQIRLSLTEVKGLVNGCGIDTKRAWETVSVTHPTSRGSSNWPITVERATQSPRVYATLKHYSEYIVLRDRHNHGHLLCYLALTVIETCWISRRQRQSVEVNAFS